MKREGQIASPEVICYRYHFLLTTYMRFLKNRSEQNFLYIKLVGWFFLISTGYFLLQEKGILSNFLAGVALFLSPQWDGRNSQCIQMGKLLEEKHPEIVSSNFFYTFDRMQSNERKAALVSRFGSFALVLATTAIAGFFLAMKVGLWLVIVVEFAAAILLVAALFLFRGVIKRNFS